MPDRVPEHSSPAPEAAETPLSFEAGLTELESVVRELEGGDLPLERALDLFEKGVKLSENCRKQLEAAEMRVEILTRKGTEPFRPPNSEKP